MLPTTISLLRNGREFICSADGSGQQVWIVDDEDNNVDEDPSDFIHGVVKRSYKMFTRMDLDGFIDLLGKYMNLGFMLWTQ